MSYLYFAKSCEIRVAAEKKQYQIWFKTIFIEVDKINLYKKKSAFLERIKMLLTGAYLSNFDIV